MLRSAQTDGLASNLPDYPYFEGSEKRHSCLVFTYIYKYIHGDNDDIAALVMRNKAIQVDTKAAGRTSDTGC